MRQPGSFSSNLHVWLRGKWHTYAVVDMFCTQLRIRRDSYVMEQIELCRMLLSFVRNCPLYKPASLGPWQVYKYLCLPRGLSLLILSDLNMSLPKLTHTIYSKKTQTERKRDRLPLRDRQRYTRVALQYMPESSGAKDGWRWQKEYRAGEDRGAAMRVVDRVSTRTQPVPIFDRFPIR